MKTPRMVIAGGTGFLGRALASYFTDRGWEVIVFGRSKPVGFVLAKFVPWNAKTLGEWTAELEGADVVVNLTGKSVNCRYNNRNSAEILNSRVDSTRVIGEAIAQCKQPPRVWFNASTATIYQHSFELAWDEKGEVGATPAAKDEFSVEVAFAWERALREAKTLNTRKVALRTSMVLGEAENSVFPVLRRLVRLGLGGVMGDGQQFVSWIHEADFCRAVEWLITHEELCGPVNIAAPNPVTNGEMMTTLRKLCGRPFGLGANRLMLEAGAMVLRTETELVIKSRKVVPGKLMDSGFRFSFPTIAEAFSNLLGLKVRERKQATQPSWMKNVLLAAGIYNLAGGAWTILFPNTFFRLVGMPSLNYPPVWQCVGMIVGVYGIGYLIAATSPLRHWPIVLVGLLGKVFGPIGMVHSIVVGTLPPSMAWTCVANDLIWWIPFALILKCAVAGPGNYRTLKTSAWDRPERSCVAR